MISNKNVKHIYIQTRLNDLSYDFTVQDYERIKTAFDENPNEYNKDHPLVSPRILPSNDYHNKDESDDITILLWNQIFGNGDFSIRRIDQIKAQGAKFIKFIDDKYPKGKGASDRVMTQYIQAQSSSSYIGIQPPSKSKKALDSFISTIAAHSNPSITDKPWLIDNLSFVSEHVKNSPDVMSREYADICLSAKMSSASVSDYKGSFRDYVLQNTLDNIIDQLDQVPKIFYLGLRHDRRGKMRAICAMDARFRIIDFLLNNGSYALCEHEGLLSKYTTEGYSPKRMWGVLRTMSDRSSGYELACVDYKGYDTQISLEEYLQISWLLNRHRARTNPIISRIFRWYTNWMRQPKPLATKGQDGLEVVIDYYSTLASGLHGTHSFENLIGISAYLESQNRGIRSKNFWTNGDDQNTMVHESDMNKYIEFMDTTFNISWDKSLVGHKLGVWGKLWFADDIHPMWEMGTFRSIWEREGGEVNMVEDSKLQSNYCKILQVAIMLIRLEESPVVIKKWLKLLCDQAGIKYDLIPRSLSTLSQLPYETSLRSDVPKGLLSAKGDLFKRTFNIKTLGVGNYFDMLLNMYQARKYYTLEPEVVEYYPRGTILTIDSGVDYSDNEKTLVPWIYSKFIEPVKYQRTYAG